MTWFNLLSTLVGAAIGLFSAQIVANRQIKNSREARAEMSRQELLKERRVQYVDFLTATRRLRYIALRTFQRQPSEGNPDEILTDMSTALYMIKIVAPQPIADSANDFYEAALDFWRLSRDKPRAKKTEWQEQQAKVRDLVHAFRREIRSDFQQESGLASSQLKNP